MASDLRGEGSRLRKRASTVIELWEGWPEPQGCADGLGGAGCWLRRYPQTGRQSQADSRGRVLTLSDCGNEAVESAGRLDTTTSTTTEG